MKLVFAFIFIMYFEPIILISRTQLETNNHKYVPKVTLLRPKGFSVTVEGLTQYDTVHLTNSRRKTVQRYKRDVNPNFNITDISQGKYGYLDMSQKHKSYSKHTNFSLIKDINQELKNNSILVRGRFQTSRKRGKQCFIVLRQQDYTIQCFLQAGTKVSQKMLKFVSNISRESIIDIVGRVQVSSVEIRSCTQKWIEILVEELWLVSKAEVLPIQVVDCVRSEKDVDPNKLSIYVAQNKKLDYRVLDLRTPANQAIFRLESVISQCFRECLINKGFVEIHTPKIINTASEGGANVFTVSYFKTSAYLAQSPQLYKQMAIAADFDKVFTIGAVFRAEESHTTQHLTEFVGLDLEMAFKYHYSEVLEVIEKLFINIFKILHLKYANEISTIRQQFPSEPFEFIDPPPRIKYSEGVVMLREEGVVIEEDDDLTSNHERLLGKLVKERFKTDFYVLYNYPISARPFYTMPDPNNSNISNSYDIFIRGEEVMSGGQRIHDSHLLKTSASHHGVDLDKIQTYIDAFRYGCPPHAGGGIGLERTVALYLGLDNVRKASMFPRDPNRLTP